MYQILPKNGVIISLAALCANMFHEGSIQDSVLIPVSPEYLLGHRFSKIVAKLHQAGRVLPERAQLPALRLPPATGATALTALLPATTGFDFC